MAVVPAARIVDQLGSPIIGYEPKADETAPLDEMLIDGAGPIAELLCAYYMLRSAIELLGDELRDPRAGTEAALPTLIDMLLLYVLRAWLDEQPSDTIGWANALRDPAITTTLRQIHRHPDKAWTVVDLAEQAGLSRAAFAKRFTTIVGQTPLAYLTWWRMTTAARMLRESAAPLRTIAARCGYGSECAFAKAFKRAYDVAPGQYRGLAPQE
jgi:transcriptional regulator GlxA family with amidase domain